MNKVKGNEMKYNNMSSTTYENMTKLSSKRENKDDLIRYHERILTRIYPKGRNIFSGNFNPISNWKVGVQMSALNLQTPSHYLRLNSAMFQQNGHSGYVLKPCLAKVSLRQSHENNTAFSGQSRKNLHGKNKNTRGKTFVMSETAERDFPPASCSR